jgi:hypothetical protein
MNTTITELQTRIANLRTRVAEMESRVNASNAMIERQINKQVAQFVASPEYRNVIGAAMLPTIAEVVQGIVCAPLGISETKYSAVVAKALGDLGGSAAVKLTA